VQDALDTIQISKEDQMKLFSMLAAVLWLGNISFSVIDNENHVEVVSNEGITSVYIISIYFFDLSSRKCPQNADI
jgi:myosin heavy subunit